MRKTISLFLAVLMMLVLLPAVRLSGTAAAESATYTKVTSAADLTDGTYLIVEPTNGFVFDGVSGNFQNYSTATITGNAITGDYTANEITIAAVTGGYTLKVPAGTYMHGTNNANGIVFGSPPAVNTVTINANGTAVIGYDDGSGTSPTTQFVYNSTSGSNGERFRYYKVTTVQGSASTYLIPALFKKNESAAPSGYVEVPASVEIPFAQIDSYVNCKNDTGAGINFSFNPVEPMKNADGDALAWTVTGGGTIEAGKTFQLTVHIDEAAWLAAKPGTYTGRIDWAESVTDDSDAVIVTAVVPESTQATLKEALADGDQVVIYNPEGAVTMSTTDYLYNNTKHELAALEATAVGNTLLFLDGTAVLTVHVDENNKYSFVNEDNQYLEIDGTHVQFVNAASANTLFQLEPQANNQFYIRCDTAAFNGNPQYLQYFSNYFTCYSLNSNTGRYLMKFYSPGEAPQPSSDDTVVLFTNDVHCGIEEGWGYAGIADLKKTLEAQGNEVLLVDAGDHIQGGPVGTLSEGEYIIDIMNFVGYDVAIPGNHEFDYNMERFLYLKDHADYPYVSANFMNYENGAPTTPVLDAYKMIEANGKKIAFVGLSTPETITKSTPTYFQDAEGNYIYGFCQDATGEGVYTAAQNAIDAATDAGADYVILVGHMGIDEQSSPWRSTEVIANITGADAFIDGHSHSTIDTEVADKDGNLVLHGQTGTKLENIGKLTIHSDGTLEMELLPASEKVKDDPETKAYIDSIKAQYEDLLNEVVAYTENTLTTKNPDTGARAVRNSETNLGDLCADAYRTLLGADVAFVNGGGVRADIPAGEITYENILNVHPFGNAAVLAEVSGQQILDALEMGARVCPGENGGFLQVSGLTYEIHTYLSANVTIDESGMWTGTAGLDQYRVQNVKVLNQTTGEYEPLDLTKTYKLASHNYMLKSQGDGMAMFGEKNITVLQDEVMLDNKVLINYIQSMPAKDVTLENGTTKHYDHVVDGYADPKGEGRITILDKAVATGDTIVLFTNDVHCGIEEGWGYAGLADLKKTLEAQGNEVLLVDAGDHIQGGPVGTLSEGEYIIDIMNFVGYDVAIPGNHEFDYGMERFLYLKDYADYPYVSANFMNYENDQPTTPVLDAYKMIEANGKKIAFVGLSTPETFTKSTPTYFQDAEGNYIYGFCQDTTGEGVYTAAQNAIDAATAAGADYVILVGHMGIDEQSSPWRSTEVIANITGADAFIDGHSHSTIDTEVADKDGNLVLHGQTGTKLENIGKLTIKADGTLEMELLPASEKVKDDAETKAYIDSIKAEYDELLQEVVAYTENPLTINDPDTGARAVRRAETNLGDLCADAYRTLLGADVAFVNGGGVRANIPVGEITYENILNVHPFGNAAVLAEVTGQQILDALEMGARVCPGENGGFLQVAGLTYEINVNAPANITLDDKDMWTGPAGIPYRVRNVMVLNRETNAYEPLDLEKTYTLASHNYMLKSQGDGMAMFGEKNITVLQDEVMLDNKVLINYIQSMPGKDVTLPDGTVKHYDHVVSAYADPKGEGRIKVYALDGVIYGEDVDAGEVAAIRNGKIVYRYDIKVKDIPAAREVVSLQAFVQFDKTALKFLEAESALSGNTGINATADGKLLFGWTSDGAGITLADEQVVVSLYFEAAKAIPAGTKLDITFTTDTHDNPSGFGYADGTNVVEAEHVDTEDGSITFGAILLGDANCDGRITSADAAATLRSVVGLTALKPQGVLNADVNGDKKITAEDAAIILRYVVNLIKTFPAA